MLRFGKTKVAKEEFKDAKKPIKNSYVDNIVVPKLIETNNSLIGYLNDVMK